MMLANALWSFLFFRAQKLFASFVSGSLAPIPDLGLLICLMSGHHGSLGLSAVSDLSLVRGGVGLWIVEDEHPAKLN